MALSYLRDAANKNDEKATIRALRKIVPSFTTPEEFNSRELQKV